MEHEAQSEPGVARTDLPPGALPPGVLTVHFGQSANCSSIGSFIDFLFVSSAVGAAAIAAVAVALAVRPGSEPDAPTADDAPNEPAADESDEGP